MSMLADAGIYVLADLSAPITGMSINSGDADWDVDLYARYTSVVDAMANYTNVLGFFAGNEVANQTSNTNAVPFVKAAVRDIKAYIKAKNYRAIGVGYATDDDMEIRVDIAEFFNCGDPSEAIDFWGYNIYSWCGDSSYSQSGYEARTQQFSSYSVPAFFAEYGCNKVEPRPFTEVAALFGPQMTPVWSGGIVFEYFQASNNFGLVTVTGNTVTPNQDFQNLKKQLAAVSPSGVMSDSYNPTNTPAACPSSGGVWDAMSTPLPPSPNEQLCSCMYDSLGCVVSSSTSETSYGKLFGTVCGLGNGHACDGITHNGSTGTYGAYGMCNSKQQLAFAFNQYYLSQKKSASACDFSGSASTQSPAGSNSICKGLLNQAGTAGTGTVTSQPSGTGSIGGGSGGSSGGSASSSSGAGARRLAAPGGNAVAEFGILPVVFITILATLSGMGMVFL